MNQSLQKVLALLAVAAMTLVVIGAWSGKEPAARFDVVLGHDATFKLDRETGQTWMFFYGQPGWTALVDWVPLVEIRSNQWCKVAPIAAP
jgi:hypothetical protein